MHRFLCLQRPAETGEIHGGQARGRTGHRQATAAGDCRIRRDIGMPTQGVAPLLRRGIHKGELRQLRQLSTPEGAARRSGGSAHRSESYHRRERSFPSGLYRRLRERTRHRRHRESPPRTTRRVRCWRGYAREDMEPCDTPRHDSRLHTQGHRKLRTSEDDSRRQALREEPYTIHIRRGHRLLGNRGRSKRSNSFCARPNTLQYAPRPQKEDRTQAEPAGIRHLSRRIARTDGNDVPRNARRAAQHSGHRRGQGKPLWQAVLRTD